MSAAKHSEAEMAEGYIGLRGAMSRAEVKAAEDEARDEVRAMREHHDAQEVKDRRLAHETRTMLADAQFRAKLLNGDTSFDSLDMADLDTLLGIADGMTQRRRVFEQVLL